MWNSVKWQQKPTVCDLEEPEYTQLIYSLDVKFSTQPLQGLYLYCVVKN